MSTKKECSIPTNEQSISMVTVRAANHPYNGGVTTWETTLAYRKLKHTYTKTKLRLHTCARIYAAPVHTTTNATATTTCRQHGILPVSPPLV